MFWWFLTKLSTFSIAWVSEREKQIFPTEKWTPACNERQWIPSADACKVGENQHVNTIRGSSDWFTGLENDCSCFSLGVSQEQYALKLTDLASVVRMRLFFLFTSWLQPASLTALLSECLIPSLSLSLPCTAFASAFYFVFYCIPVKTPRLPRSQ